MRCGTALAATTFDDQATVAAPEAPFPSTGPTRQVPTPVPAPPPSADTPAPDTPDPHQTEPHQRPAPYPAYGPHPEGSTVVGPTGGPSPARRGGRGPWLVAAGLVGVAAVAGLVGWMVGGPLARDQTPTVEIGSTRVTSERTDADQGPDRDGDRDEGGATGDTGPTDDPTDPDPGSDPESGEGPDPDPGSDPESGEGPDGGNDGTGNQQDGGPGDQPEAGSRYADPAAVYGSYVAVLWSEFGSGPETDTNVEAELATQRARFGDQVIAIDSNHFRSLRDGTVAVVFQGGFASARAAKQWCRANGFLGVQDCFGVVLSDDHTHNDRGDFIRVYELD